MIDLQLALTFLRGNWRWMLPLAGILFVLGLLAYARHEHTVATTAKAVARDATHHAEVAEHTGRITAKTAENRADILRISEEARHAVEQAPDYDSGVSAYLNGIDRLRQAGSAPVDPDDPGSHTGS